MLERQTIRPWALGWVPHAAEVGASAQRLGPVQKSNDLVSVKSGQLSPRQLVQEADHQLQRVAHCHGSWSNVLSATLVLWA